VQVVSYQFVLSFVLLFFLSTLLKYDKGENWVLYLLGPVGFIAVGNREIPVIRVRLMFLILSYLLAAGSLFIPFHNVIFNIVFFLYFFILGQLFFEDEHIDFVLTNVNNVETIQELLNVGGKSK
jgi:hypothetical protein